MPARFRSLCGGEVTWWLQKDILIVSFFWRGGQLLAAERHNHRFDVFWKAVATRGTFYCSHYHLNIPLFLVHSRVTNVRDWFTFNASSRAKQRQISRNSVYHRVWRGIVFLPAVTIPLAIVSCKFHYRPPWKKTTYRQGPLMGIALLLHV